MILGLDHVGFGVPALPADWPGYDGVFQADNVPNAPEKQPLMRQWQSHHHLRLLTPRQQPGVRLELIAYGEPLTDVVSEARSQPPIQVQGEIVTVTGTEVEKAFWAGWFNNADLQLRSPLGLGCQLAVQPPTEGPTAYHRLTFLDDPGFNSLAFLVTRFSAEADRLTAAGAQTACQPFHLMVNQTPLFIGFFRSPAGHLLELIEPQRH